MNIKKKIIGMAVTPDPDTTCYHFEVEPQYIIIALSNLNIQNILLNLIY